LETTKTFILNTRLISCLLKRVNLSICSHASNKKHMRKVFKSNPLIPNFQNHYWKIKLNPISIKLALFKNSGFKRVLFLKTSFVPQMNISKRICEPLLYLKHQYFPNQN
jgi:hypothetical protein